MGLIFTITLVLLVYALIHIYIGLNIWVYLKHIFSLKKPYVFMIIFLVLALAMFIGRIFSIEFLTIFGYYWLFFVYVSIIVLPILNLVYFLIKGKYNKRKLIFILGLLKIISMAVFVSVGTYNAYSPIVQKYDIDVSKKEKELKIIMASDMHFGVLSNKKHAEKMVKKINEQSPDIVLFPGDIIDDQIGHYKKQNISSVLKKINAPFGVYASLGNHDYEDEELKKELEKANITLLIDEAVLVNNSFYVLGRKDASDKERLSLKDIVTNLDDAYPIFALDHQPSKLDEARENGIFLLVSGHTHKGQLYPASLITEKVFENDYGYIQKDNMHSVVSSGYGFWGPPFRIGTRSEIVEINIKKQ